MHVLLTVTNKKKPINHIFTLHGQPTEHNCVTRSPIPYSCAYNGMPLYMSMLLCPSITAFRYRRKKSLHAIFNGISGIGI